MTYEQVSMLELTPLRVLLREGQSVERVWAAWVLGLRLGDQLTKELAPQWRKEPDAGVRRHLLVVLAGAGQRDGLAAIAQADPDEHVRASAVRLLLQTARPEQLAATVAQLIDFSRCDRHPLVVERILELLEARWPAARRDVLLSLLGARALGVRQAALRALRGSELLDTKASQVLERAFVEQERQSLDPELFDLDGDGSFDTWQASLDDLRAGLTRLLG